MKKEVKGTKGHYIYDFNDEIGRGAFGSVYKGY